MSKKAPVKKSRRRLKRSIRRSLAAVLMITAIGVAAIPVPENVAAPEDYNIMPYAADDAYTAEYGYPANIAQLNMRDYNGIDLSGNGEYKSYTITQKSSENYELAWQFKFFITLVNGISQGIITEYNSSYDLTDVELKSEVIYKYDVVEAADYDSFYKNPANTSEKTYSIDKPGDGSYAEEFLKTYFENDYNDYVGRYNATLDKEAWDESLSRTVDQIMFSQAYMRRYYCDVNTSPGDGFSLKGFELVLVSDTTDDETSGGRPTITDAYIPRKLGEAEEGEKVDGQKFKYLERSNIIGIGDNAFHDTKVQFLSVPEIKYVGDNAFKGSQIEKVSFVNVENIGNGAFKGCTGLTQVDFGEKITVIGSEAFYGTGLTNLDFPSSVNRIGPGAFADCSELQTIDFSRIPTSNGNRRIDEYAFFNDVKLDNVNFYTVGSETNTVNINTIGEGAFAVDIGLTGNMSTFVFPSYISEENTQGGLEGVGLGDFVLAGRKNLQYVTLPAEYGRRTETNLPDNLLYDCINLICVIFPDDGGGSCGFASYDPDVFFITVENPDFYVWGPRAASGRSHAIPREKTWDAKTARSDVVPYMYKIGEEEFYEVSHTDEYDVGYLLSISGGGVLNSCELRNESDEGSDIEVLMIPAKVGNTRVIDIGQNCFSDGVANAVRNLVIQDDSLSSIGNSVFQGSGQRWQKLQSVVIGDSVTSIGNNAFAGCKNLVDVTFHHKDGTGYDLNIGNDAFKTGGQQLTFHGEIQNGYEPYDMAVDKERSIIDPIMNTRICYKSLAPNCLTIMYDADTGYVTLLDYPKYDQVPDLLYETHKWDILLGGYTSYGEMRAYQQYDLYRGENYNSYRENFWNDWLVMGEAAYESSDWYGPWIYPNCYSGRSLVQAGSGDTTSQTNQDSVLESVKQTLNDVFLEPIVAYAAPDGYPLPYYDENGKYAYDVLKNYENGLEISEPERQLIDATKNIVVPAGVESIDATRFLRVTNDSVNYRNVMSYFYPDSRSGGGLPDKVYNMYTDRDGDTVPGLFSGYYVDYNRYAGDVSGNDSSGNNAEVYYRGNDRIESVTLTSVKYLPDYAFDSCEKLKKVVIGGDLEDIGTSPFRGCYSMVSVSNNDYYTTENGIIYHTVGNEDGSYTIEEVLSTRGRLDLDLTGVTDSGAISNPSIGLTPDALLNKVSIIKPSAFEDCQNVQYVDLQDTVGLVEIPKKCFKDCINLQTVLLPETVNSIEEGAFVHDSILTTLTIPGKEVFISTQAFETDANKRIFTKVRTFKDSSARRYVDTYGSSYKLEFEDIGDRWQVTFVDMDGTQLGDIITVPDGYEFKLADAPVPPEKEDFVFSGEWVGTNGLKLGEPITRDTIYVAQYYSTAGMVDGNYVVTFYDGVDGKVFNTQYVAPGKDATEPKEPVHAGYTFIGWSDTFTNIRANKSIIALYSGGGNGGGDSTTTGSSGTTTTGSSGTTTTGSSGTTTTGSNGSTSNTSGSSTSATSTTSESAGLYTLTVINGSGSGSYAAGTTVIITANSPATGQVFNKWTTETEGVTFTNSTLSVTTITMPASNATVTAEFGSGSGTVPTSASGGSGSPVGVAGNGNTRVDITKPGISNKDLATATVNGSTDNFVVKISETPEATQAVANALTGKYGNLENILYYAMDISLYDSTGTTKISDITGLTVDITIPIPDALVAYGGNNMAGAVVSDQTATDKLEDMAVRFSTIEGVPCVSFTATHFSPYTIYVDTSNLAAGMLDVTPKTGDPIHPKWFLSIGLACLSIILFMKKDKRVVLKKA